MKRFAKVSVAGLLAGAVLSLNTGCDWSSGGSTNSFNTSQGAGINMNFSGVYRGELSGGKVANTSAGNIQTLTLSQVGNSVTVIDNQGSTYTGSVGSPGLVASPVNGAYPTGAELVQSQINFSGKDGVSAKDIQFSGILHVISVRDIQGTTSEYSYDESDVKTTTSKVVGQNTTETITTVTIGVPTDPFYQVTTTTVVTDNNTGSEISRTTSTTGNTTVSSVFEITEANSQYRLEGTWVEVGGIVSPVQARSPGTFGVIQTEDPIVVTVTP